MTKLEEVARAICSAAGSNPDRGYGFVDDGRLYWLHFEHIARAAVEAMRIPTKEMLEAVWELDNAFQSESSIEDVWTPMIDAILHPSK